MHWPAGSGLGPFLFSSFLGGILFSRTGIFLFWGGLQLIYRQELRVGEGALLFFSEIWIENEGTGAFLDNQLGTGDWGFFRQSKIWGRGGDCDPNYTEQPTSLPWPGCTGVYPDAINPKPQYDKGNLCPPWWNFGKYWTRLISSSSHCTPVTVVAPQWTYDK